MAVTCLSYYYYSRDCKIPHPKKCVMKQRMETRGTLLLVESPGHKQVASYKRYQKKSRVRSMSIPKMSQKAQNMPTYLSPQQKCECYKARGTMQFTSIFCAYRPCLAISRHLLIDICWLNKPSRSTFCSINISLIYSVCVPRYRFTLQGGKKTFPK